MAHSGHLELIGAEPEGVRPPASDTAPAAGNLATTAAKLAHSLAWIPGQVDLSSFNSRCRTMRKASRPLLEALYDSPIKTGSDDVRLLHENLLLIDGQIDETCETFAHLQKLPQVRMPNGLVAPRVAAIATDYLAAVSYKFTPANFTEYIQAFQDVTVLDLAELWMLVPALNLVLLEHIAEEGRRVLQDPIRRH